MKFKCIFLFITFIYTSNLKAQESQETLLTQFSPFLSKAYYNFNLGIVRYPFTNDNLNDGTYAGGIRKNGFSGRFLLGYKFTEDLAIQFGVMRPATWFEFTDINGQKFDKSVWINLWSLSFKKNFNINKRLAFYAEAGVGNLNRVGTRVGGEVVYPDAHYASLVTGAGFKYTLNKNWDLMLNGMYLPESKKHNQPYTLQTSLGLLYNFKQIPREEAEDYANNESYFFPKRFIQIGYANSDVGFFPNRFFSMNAKVGNTESVGLPVFWLGDSKAAHTLSITYQQTAFHTEKLFSLDWGVSITGFQTEATKTNVFAFSVFPVLRFYVMRKKPMDLYINYSVIGPTFLTKKNIDNLATGPKLTYQDFMGIGMFVGEKRKLNFELRIMHYSNGNIFSKNSGVAIPVVFTVGKTL